MQNSLTSEPATACWPQPWLPEQQPKDGPVQLKVFLTLPRFPGHYGCEARCRRRWTAGHLSRPELRIWPDLPKYDY